jgi:hypothetical protein
MVLLVTVTLPPSFTTPPPPAPAVFPEMVLFRTVTVPPL